MLPNRRRPGQVLFSLTRGPRSGAAGVREGKHQHGRPSTGRGREWIQGLLPTREAAAASALSHPLARFEPLRPRDRAAHAQERRRGGRHCLGHDGCRGGEKVEKKVFSRSALLESVLLFRPLNVQCLHPLGIPSVCWILVCLARDLRVARGDVSSRVALLRALLLCPEFGGGYLVLFLAYFSKTSFSSRPRCGVLHERHGIKQR